MPTASAEADAAMKALFGEGADWEAESRLFLTRAGYALQPGFVWKPKPGVTIEANMTDDEWDCTRWLAEEWDFGGLEP